MKQIVRDYIAELRSSPAKACTIAVMFAVGLLLWGRLLLKEVPRTASAWGQGATVADADTALAPRRNLGVLELSPPPPLARDLFVMDPSRYRRTGLGEENPDGAKRGIYATEEALRQAVLSAAREMTVNSVIEGEEPIVIINGKVLRQGDTVEGFTVQKIEPRSVVLEQEGVRVRLGL